MAVRPVLTTFSGTVPTTSDPDNFPTNADQMLAFINGVPAEVNEFGEWLDTTGLTPQVGELTSSTQVGGFRGRDVDGAPAEMSSAVAAAKIGSELGLPVSFDTVANFHAVTITQLREISGGAATGTAYITVNDSGHRYSVDLEQVASFEATTSPGGVQYNVLENKDGSLSAVAFAEPSPTEFSASINAALRDGQTVNLPSKIMRITSGIVIPEGASLNGSGYDHNLGGTSGTHIVKDGNFVGITLEGDRSGIARLTVDGEVGNGGDGIHVAGSRCTISHVGTHSNGGSGIRLGTDDPSSNTNSWRIDGLYSTANGGDGVYFHHNDPAPDANAGIATLIDARSNGGDGIRIQNVIDNQFYMLTTQENTGYGLRLMSGARGNYIPHPYIEANVAGECLLEAGSEQNWIQYYRQGSGSDLHEDLGSGNIIIGKSSKLSPSVPFVRSKYAFENPIIMDRDISGHWSLLMDPANRDLRVELLGTGSVARLKMPTYGVKWNSGQSTNDLHHAGGTLNFGTVAAQGGSSATISLPGVLVAEAGNYSVSVNTTGAALPASLSFANAFVSADGQVTIQMSNASSAGVAASSVACRVVALRVG